MRVSKQERVLVAAALFLLVILVAYHVFYSQQLKPPIIVYESDTFSFSISGHENILSSMPDTSGMKEELSYQQSNATPQNGLPSLKSVNPNIADLKTLCLLPGIGETIAGRIIEYRETYGPFRQLSDLKKVKGIGDKIFAKIEPYLTL